MFENIKSNPEIVEKIMANSKNLFHDCRGRDKPIFSNSKEISAKLDQYLKIVENQSKGNSKKFWLFPK